MKMKMLKISMALALVVTSLTGCSKTVRNRNQWVSIDKDGVQRAFNVTGLGEISLTSSDFTMDFAPMADGFDGDLSLRIEDSYSLSGSDRALEFHGYAASYIDDYMDNQVFHVSFEGLDNPDEVVVVDGFLRGDHWDTQVRYRLYEGDRIVFEENIGQAASYDY